jgi:protocatechuate 3,4-dioxygenase beta subunit
LASTQDAAELAAFKALPLGEIEELILNPAGTVAIVPKAAPPVITDDRGQFRFTTVEPGTYRLIFSGAGYARQDYGQRTAGGGVPLTLTGGQSKTDIVMRMLPVAAVSGRVRDAAGQTLAGVPVELGRFSYGETGQRQVQRVTATRTDDHGEYRMFYLSPGRYYVTAGNPPGQNVPAAPGGIESLLGGVYTS